MFAIALTLLIIDVRIPPTVTMGSAHDLWLALGHIAPSIYSFLLSFVVILITWVNHHAGMKLVNKSSPKFVYANGLLLLSVVIIPFPTALLGQYLLTNHAAPAVILYSAVFGLQGLGWLSVTSAALTPPLLAKSDKARLVIAKNRQYSIFAIAFYAACAVAAIWLPQVIAVVISLVWVFWIIVGINTRDE